MSSRRDAQRGASGIVVFGRHPVEAALDSQGVQVEGVAVLRSRPGPERDRLRKRCEAHGVPFEEIARSAMDALTGAPRHDQGIAARVRLSRVGGLDAVVAASRGRGARRPVRLLALDGVTNSQNVGMVVRSLVAAGFDGLLWPRVGQPWINGLVVRAAVGAIFECPIVLCDALPDGLGRLQGAGFRVLGLAAGAVTTLFASQPPHRAVYVLGSESQGLSGEVEALLDERLSIPMQSGVESLNVAVAAGLVCYHATGAWRTGAGDAAIGAENA
ncbi:MAG: RNA methyltransferase [Myxococcota bacterium]